MEFFMVKGYEDNPKLHIRFTKGGRRKGGAIKTIRDFIKDEYVGKQFNIPIANRTKIIRLFMKAIKPCKKDGGTIKTRIAHFLQRYHLSRAERHAILFKLGYRYKVKRTKGLTLRNMKINGYLDHQSRNRKWENTNTENFHSKSDMKLQKS